MYQAIAAHRHLATQLHVGEEGFELSSLWLDSRDFAREPPYHFNTARGLSQAKKSRVPRLNPATLDLSLAPDGEPPANLERTQGGLPGPGF